MVSRWLSQITRRSFLDWLIGGSLFATLSGVFATAVAFLLPPAGATGSSEEFIKVAATDELPPKAHKKVIYHGKPVYLINTGSEYIALSAICTHLGCIVHMKGDAAACQQEMPPDVIHCVCHAGVFDVHGNVVSGPPPRPLPRYRLRITGNIIYLGGLMEGERLYG